MENNTSAFIDFTHKNQFLVIRLGVYIFTMSTKYIKDTALFYKSFMTVAHPGSLGCIFFLYLAIPLHNPRGYIEYS